MKLVVYTGLIRRSSVHILPPLHHHQIVNVVCFSVHKLKFYMVFILYWLLFCTYFELFPGLYSVESLQSNEHLFFCIRFKVEVVFLS